MPAHNNGGLLFVNKTSLSRSFSNSKADADDLKEIHKHVQKSRDYGKEKETRKKLKRARLLSSRGTPISVAPRQTPAVAALLTPPETPIVKPISPLVNALDDRRYEETERDRHNFTRNKHDVTRLSLVMPSGSSLEPFGQFNTYMNAE